MKLKINNITFDFELYVEKSSTYGQDAIDDTDDNPSTKRFCLNGLKEPELCGVTLRALGKVFINKEINENQLLSTITHEMTHCYIWAYGLNQFDKFSEENVCDFIAAYGESIINDSIKVYNTLVKEK